VTDEADRAMARLVSQFRGRERIELLIRLLADEAQPALDAFEDIKAKRSLVDAEGAQLDAIGALYRFPRDGLLDAEYRPLLQAFAVLVSSRGRPQDLIRTLETMDDGHAPSSLRLVEHHPAGMIMTATVEDGDQRYGEKMGRLLRRQKAAGVSFVFLFQYDTEADHFVWSGETGEGWAEETDPSGTGGIWAEGV